MKKLMLLAGLYCLQPSLHAATSPSPAKNNLAPISATSRAQAHFNANYKKAYDVAWYTLDDQNIICIAHQGDTINRVFYDKHGYWQYTLLTYPGYGLPRSVKEKVLDYFNCYQISSVNEVRSHGGDPVFVINIENEDHIKVIKVAGDELEVQKELEKR